MTKIALITGATSGIGKATAEAFGKAGYNLILTGRREERLMEVSNTIAKKLAVNVLPLVFDVQDRAAVQQNLANLPDNWKAVDVLVNNAGLAVGLESIHEGNPDDWDQMIDTNIKGLLYVSRAIIPLMVQREKGHIFNMSSIAGVQVYRGGNVYCATKHAVRALSRAMRIELAQHNIRVTDIEPGKVDTEFSLVRFKGDQEKAKNIYTGPEPLHAQDIAAAILDAAQKPAHVCINEINITCISQPDAFHSIS